MGRNNWEPEDGMGFAGLVPTAAEKSQERYEERQRQQTAQLRAALAASEQRNRELTRQVEQLQAVLRNLIAALPDTRRLLIAREDAQAALTAPPSSSDPGRADTEVTT